MIAVITGDIISSRLLTNQDLWLVPLKEMLSKWGSRPIDWEINRGDSFQIEISNVEEALYKALEIKALIKSLNILENSKTKSPIDVRMAIGIGSKTYSGSSINESNGEAFIYSGEKFDSLKKENINLAIKSSWTDFDEDINLYLKLTSIFMDNWSISSAELVSLVLKYPEAKQDEIGDLLGIQQSGVSRRWDRANINYLLEVEALFRKKLHLVKL